MTGTVCWHCIYWTCSAGHPGSPLVLLPCWLWQCLAYMLHLISTHWNSAPPLSLLGVCSGHVQNRDKAKYYSSTRTHAQSRQIVFIFWSKWKAQNAIIPLTSQHCTMWIMKGRYNLLLVIDIVSILSTSTLFRVLWGNLWDCGMYTTHVKTHQRNKPAFQKQLVFML